MTPAKSSPLAGSNGLLEAALGYACRGWAVLPVKARGKTPLITKWPTAATTNIAQIEAWWQKWPSANVGLACGHQSGALAVDLDSLEAQQHLDQLAWPHGGLPPTLTSLTARGRHLYFEISRDKPLRSRVLSPGLEREPMARL